VERHAASPSEIAPILSASNITPRSRARPARASYFFSQFADLIERKKEAENKIMFNSTRFKTFSKSLLSGRPSASFAGCGARAPTRMDEHAKIRRGRGNNL
jgi:hypothetical protein